MLIENLLLGMSAVSGAAAILFGTGAINPLTKEATEAAAKQEPALYLFAAVAVVCALIAYRIVVVRGRDDREQAKVRADADREQAKIRADAELAQAKIRADADRYVADVNRETTNHAFGKIDAMSTTLGAALDRNTAATITTGERLETVCKASCPRGSGE